MADTFETRVEKGNIAAHEGDFSRAAHLFEYASELGDMPGHIQMLERARMAHELIDIRPFTSRAMTEDYRIKAELDNLLWLATLHDHKTRLWHDTINARLAAGARTLYMSHYTKESQSVEDARLDFQRITSAILD